VNTGSSAGIRRGAIVTVGGPGNFDNPRSAVVIQTDYLTDAGLGSIILALMTAHIGDAPLFRLTVEPARGNGLRKTSQVMLDKLVAVRRSRIGEVIGYLDDACMLNLNRSLAFVVGLAG
jgi:mRNA interferase MazF